MKVQILNLEESLVGKTLTLNRVHWIWLKQITRNYEDLRGINPLKMSKYEDLLIDVYITKNITLSRRETVCYILYVEIKYCPLVAFFSFVLSVTCPRSGKFWL